MELLEGTADYSRREFLMRGQSDLLNMISNGEPLEYIFTEIIKWVEEHSEVDVYSSILLVDERGQCLLHGAAPSLPIEYNNAIHGMRIGPAAGPCGTAAFTGKTTIVEDIAADPLWADYKDIALRFNLRSCWSVPLVTKKGKVLGTFAIYHSIPYKPTEEDLQLMELASRIALLAIEFRDLEKGSRKHEEDESGAALIKNERQRFYQLLMKAPAIIVIFRGRDHVFELANERCNELAGRGRQLLGLPLVKALPEIEKQGFIAILDRVYATGEPYYGDEVPVQLDRNDDGNYEECYLNFSFTRLDDEWGATEGVFVHAVDITDQVLARKMAEESESRFRNFVYNAPTPIGIYVGREMRIQTVNDAILAAWDKKDASEVMGKTFREVLPELEGQPFYQLLDDVYMTGIPYQANEDKVYLMRNGKLSTTYYNFTYSPLKNERGEVFGVMNTATEVTDLVIARQKLSAKEAELKNAIDVADLATWSLDLKSRQITLSERLCKWLGVSGSILPLDKVLALVSGHDQALVGAKFSGATHNDDILEVEFSVVNAMTRHARTLHFKGKVETEDGGRACIKGAANDVTLQRNLSMELERQVEQRTIELQQVNAELQNVNENLKQFAYVASHDLQEPLRKIKIYTDMLRTNQKDRLDALGQRHLERVEKSAERMSSLIKALLEFSKVSDDKDLREPVNLNELLNRIKVDYEVLIEEKNAVVNIDCLGSIQAIPLQMNQLFFNLIGNALKFSRPNMPPIVDVWSREVPREELPQHYGLNPNYDYREIIVSDNGIGFDQTNADKIFEIFQRLHNNDDFEGTGIGLALCKKIVTAHEGAIHVRSEEGTGSAFYVILPVERS